VTIQGNKARALLALLVVHANRHVPTDVLEDELWDGAPPRGARSTVQAHISRLRSVIGASGVSAVVSGGAGGYELRVEPSAIDAYRFETLATRGADALARDPRLAADLSARALDEWRGSALQDVRQVPSLYIEAERLDELRLTTIESRMAAEIHAGSHLMAVGSLQRLVDEHPLREQLRALLMLALYRSGRQAEALRAYQAGHAALAEIGLRPGRDLRDLEEAIAREDPSLLAPSTPGPPSPVRVVPASEVEPRPRSDRRLLLVEGPDAARAVGTLADRASHDGQAVLRGHAPTAVSRPYQAVVEAIAPLLAENLDAALGRAMAPIVAPVAPAQAIDPAYERYRAFEAILAVLTRAARRQPLFLLIDDIDHAGTSTLDLLEHLARRDVDAPLTLVVARATTSPNSVLDAWLRRLERDGLVERLPAGTDVAADASPREDAQADASDHAARAADAFAHASALSARAGDDALLRLGFDEAADHYRAAITAVDLTPGSQTCRRAELHLALGHACQSAYRLDDAIESYRRAAAFASEVGDVHLLAQAAVGVATATEFGMADDETAAVLSAALDVVPDDSPVRVELLAGLARTFPGSRVTAVATAKHAVRLARELDARRSLAVALATSVLVTWEPDAVVSRLADIDEVIALAADLELVELAIEAHVWRAATLHELGRDEEADADTAVVRRWAERSRRPFFLALASMLSIADHLRHGRLAAADEALTDLPSGAETGPNFSEGFAAQLFLLRRQQGRAHEFLPLFDMLAEDQRGPAAWNAARVLTLAEAGQPGASEALEEAVARLSEASKDWLWLATVALLADACIHLGARTEAAELSRRLAPHREQTAIVAHGVASLGPVRPRLDALQRLASSREASNRLLLSGAAAG
jgi:DNA-binding SARP family transcriptional activator